MDECIFCKLVSGKIPCSKIYENEFVLAFLDINPIAKGHTLVISKKHFVNIFDADEKYLIEVILATKKIAEHYKNDKSLFCTGVNVMHASGIDAQQSVFHLHFHIIPRYKDDGHNTWPHTNYQKEDINVLAEKINLKS